jgi:zinc transport system ATP-binding protein
MKKVLSVKNLSVSFNGQYVLKDINLSVSEQEVVAIIGPNGSGKTTLLKAILGLIPFSGEITVPHSRSSEKNIGYVPQRFLFDPQFPITVSELIDTSFPRPQKDKKHRIMEETGITHLAGRMIGSLSGGELQRALIARSAIRSPKLWLLDEATTGIDAQRHSDFFELVYKMKEKWKSGMIIVSHEMSVVHRLADRVICLNKEIVFEGKADKALSTQSFKKLYGEEFNLISEK